MENWTNTAAACRFLKAGVSVKLKDFVPYCFLYKVARQVSLIPRQTYILL